MEATPHPGRAPRTGHPAHPLLDRSRRSFAELADATERDLHERDIELPAFVVDAAVNTHVAHVAEMLDVHPDDALEHVPPTSSARIADAVEQAASTAALVDQLSP